MTDVGLRPRPAAAAAPPTAGGMVLAHARHAAAAFRRTPVAAFFTLAFPLIWLAMLVLLVGNERIPTPVGTVRLAQYLTPVAAVFAVVMAAFTSLAISVSLDRERRVLVRLRGTPAPSWTYLAGQVLSVAVIALLGTAVMLAAGMLLYGAEIVWTAMPAMVVTLLVGIVCSAALGLAVAALAPSSGVTTAVTTGSVIVLGFLSDMFTIGGELPRWLDTIGWIFPLRHFARAMAEAFDPFAGGLAWSPGALAVMTAWAAFGALVAARALRFDPRRDRASTGGGRRSGRLARGAGRRSRPPVPRSTARLLRAQIGYADRTLRRDPGSWFFGIAFPVLLLALMGVIWSDSPIARELLPGLAVFGAATTTFATLPETVARARQSGVLARLRGTPMPMWIYVAGWLGAALWSALLCFGGLLVVVGIAFGADFSVAGIPGAVAVLALGTGVLAALGLALMAALPDPRTLSVVGLAVLLPLSFLSGLFPFGGEPSEVVRRLGAVFPLQHLRDAMDEALTGGWSAIAPHHLVVAAVWGGVAVLVAVRLLTRHRG